MAGGAASRKPLRLEMCDTQRNPLVAVPGPQKSVSVPVAFLLGGSLQALQVFAQRNSTGGGVLGSGSGYNAFKALVGPGAAQAGLNSGAEVALEAPAIEPYTPNIDEFETTVAPGALK